MYIQMFSVHGLLRGSNFELGQDADTGGQIRYVVEMAKQLAEHDEVEGVDLFTRMLSPRGQYLQDLFAKLATILYLAIFTWQAWIMAIQQTEKGEVWEAAGFYVAVWPTRWLLPFAGALMLLYLVLRLVGDALRVRRA